MAQNDDRDTLFGFPIVFSSDVPSAQYTFGDLSAYIRPISVADAKRIREIREKLTSDEGGESPAPEKGA